MKKILLFILLALGALSAPANAQQAQALIVASCGTAPAYVAGTYGILTMDTTGALCNSVSGGSVLASIGSPSDAACGTAAGTCSLIALVKYNNNTGNNPIPAGNAANGGTSGNIGAVAQFGSPWNVAVQYGSIALVADPCQSNVATFTPISISASGITRIIQNTFSQKIYICHIHVVTTAGDNVAPIGGGSSCTTGVTGLAGGTTAANGWNFAINSGIALGNGASAIMATAASGDDFCLTQSAAVQLSGLVKWVHAP